MTKQPRDVSSFAAPASSSAPRSPRREFLRSLLQHTHHQQLALPSSSPIIFPVETSGTEKEERLPSGGDDSQRHGSAPLFSLLLFFFPLLFIHISVYFSPSFLFSPSFSPYPYYLSSHILPPHSNDLSQRLPPPPLLLPPLAGLHP